MSKQRSPAFQFYPDKWSAGTEHLSDQAYRAYHKIMCWMWLNSPDYCSMADNKTMWIITTGIKDDDKLEAVKNEIQNPDFLLLRKINGRLVSNGLKKEADKQKAYSELQSKRAQKPRHSPGTAPAQPEASIPSHSPFPSLSINNNEDSPAAFLKEVISLNYPSKQKDYFAILDSAPLLLKIFHPDQQGSLEALMFILNRWVLLYEKYPKLNLFQLAQSKIKAGYTAFAVAGMMNAIYKVNSPPGNWFAYCEKLAADENVLTHTWETDIWPAVKTEIIKLPGGTNAKT